jgi:hypothetical protein
MGPLALSAVLLAAKPFSAKSNSSRTTSAPSQTRCPTNSLPLGTHSRWSLQFSPTLKRVDLHARDNARRIDIEAYRFGEIVAEGLINPDIASLLFGARLPLL